MQFGECILVSAESISECRTSFKQPEPTLDCNYQVFQQSVYQSPRGSHFAKQTCFFVICNCSSKMFMHDTAHLIISKLAFIVVCRCLGSKEMLHTGQATFQKQLLACKLHVFQGKMDEPALRTWLPKPIWVSSVQVCWQAAKQFGLTCY